jgi:hypothetical protein
MILEQSLFPGGPNFKLQKSSPSKNENIYVCGEERKQKIFSA